MNYIDRESNEAFDDQIKTRLREQLTRGVLQVGDRVPSVPQLAEELVLNPKIVLKAYQCLMDEGFLYYSRGVGLFIADTAKKTIEKDLEQKLTSLFELCRSNGFPTERVLSILERCFANGISQLQRLPTESTGSFSVLAVSKQVLCPFCRERITNSDSQTICRFCNTSHHEDCWVEIGRCAIFGCEG